MNPILRLFCTVLFLTGIYSLPLFAQTNDTDAIQELHQELQLLKKEQALVDEKQELTRSKISNELQKEIGDNKQAFEDWKRDINWYLRVIGLLGIVGIGGLITLFLQIRKLKTQAYEYAKAQAEAAIDKGIQERIVKLLKKGELKEYVKAHADALKDVITLKKLEQDVLETHHLLAISGSKVHQSNFDQLLSRAEIPTTSFFRDPADLSDDATWKKLMKKHDMILVNNRKTESNDQPFGNPNDPAAPIYQLLSLIPVGKKIMVIGPGFIQPNKVSSETYAQMTFASMDAQIKGNLLRLLLATASQ